MPFLIFCSQFWAYERLPCLRPVTVLGLDTYPRGRRWHHSTLEETPVSGSFAHCRVQLELLSAADVTWAPYSPTDLTVGFTDGYPSDPEFALSTRRIAFLTVGGWELYLGDRAFRCVTGEIRISVSLPSRSSWPLEYPPPETMLVGEDGLHFSSGPSTSEAFSIWWRPRSIGPQTRATFFLGDMVSGSVMMTDWADCVRAPTHADQIAALTRRLDRWSLFIRALGRTPEEADAYDPDGIPSGAGPSSSSAPARPYFPDLNFGAGVSTSADGLETHDFLDDFRLD